MSNQVSCSSVAVSGSLLQKEKSSYSSNRTIYSISSTHCSQCSAANVSWLACSCAQFIATQAVSCLQMRSAVQTVAGLFPTSIISGRGREKVEGFVQLKELFYAGSHGMDIVGPQVCCNCPMQLSYASVFPCSLTSLPGPSLVCSTAVSCQQASLP